MSPGATVWIIDELLDNKVAPRHRMQIITPDFFWGGVIQWIWQKLIHFKSFVFQFLSLKCTNIADIVFLEGFYGDLNTNNLNKSAANVAQTSHNNK